MEAKRKSLREVVFFTETNNKGEMGNPENREYCVLFMQFVIFIYLYRDENKTTVSSRVIASPIKL